MASGRFAPSPTGRLHLGNLRTALVAWLAARADGSAFHLRFDDLDTAVVREEHYATQLADLEAIGLEWDHPVVHQSDHLDRYRAAVDELVAAELVYPCYCSRREIREAAQAPNRPLSGHAYPGTCRDLDRATRAEREATGRRPALRLRSPVATRSVPDLVCGTQTFEVDDFVIQRNDGTPAYHLVTVVDDDALAIELVVRGDDLLDSAARQLVVADVLGLDAPDHAHVPLVLSPDRERLAKRHGAVTLADRAALGESTADVVGTLVASLGLGEPDTPVDPGDLGDLAGRFDLAALPRNPLVLAAPFLAEPDTIQPTRPARRHRGPTSVVDIGTDIDIE
ncbi:MAG: tRNA glutamyl-Q(34) synthetase GluQRS [Actinomycetota bacterium]